MKEDEISEMSMQESVNEVEQKESWFDSLFGALKSGFNAIFGRRDDTVLEANTFD